MKILLTGALILIACLAVYTQLTIFVVPPIGAVPDGRTLILWRYSIQADGVVKGLKLEFVDTADAACTRTMGYVNLL